MPHGLWCSLMRSNYTLRLNLTRQLNLISRPNRMLLNRSPGGLMLHNPSGLIVRSPIGAGRATERDRKPACRPVSRAVTT